MNFRDNTLSKENEKLFKNSITPLISLFTTYFTLPLEDFSVDQWFTRLNSGSLYYDEIGIGGTISHVTTEYGAHLSKIPIPKNETLCSLLFHRILKVFRIILPMIKQYTKN